MREALLDTCSGVNVIFMHEVKRRGLQVLPNGRKLKGIRTKPINSLVVVKKKLSLGFEERWVVFEMLEGKGKMMLSKSTLAKYQYMLDLVEVVTIQK